jgi:phosphohistidine phosphatase
MPTLVDLLRHGEAVPSHPDGDSARPLSPRGVAAIEALARRFAVLGPGPDRVFTSPLLRARETAALMCAALGHKAAPEILTELVPDSEPAEVLVALAAAAPDARHLLLVGHQPLLGDLAGHLCDGKPRTLKPGNLIRVEFGDRPARRAGRVRSIEPVR